MNKKPRKWAIHAKFDEPVTTLGIAQLPDGSIQYFSDGVPINRAKVDYETIYVREKKKKVIHKFVLGGARITDNPDLSLKKFDFVYAVDTNTRAGDGKVISVATVVMCILDFAVGGTINYQYGPLHSLEFWNIKDHPENVAWMKVIQFITQDQGYHPTQKIGIIVDSDLGNLAAYNAGSLPIYDDFYLPKNFELMYASADVGTEEFLVNHLIALCDAMAKSLLSGILRNQVSGTNPSEANNEPYTHFRLWNFTGFPQENETGG